MRRVAIVLGTWMLALPVLAQPIDPCAPDEEGLIPLECQVPPPLVGPPFFFFPASQDPHLLEEPVLESPFITPGPPPTTPGPAATTPGPAATTPGPAATTPGPAATTPGPAATTPGPAATTPGPAGQVPVR